MRQGLTYLIRFLTMLGGVLLFAVSCEEEGVENIEPQIIVSEASYSVFEKGVKVSCGYSDPRDPKGKEQTVVISFVTTAEWSVTIGNGSVKWLTQNLQLALSFSLYFYGQLVGVGEFSLDVFTRNDVPAQCHYILYLRVLQSLDHLLDILTA